MPIDDDRGQRPRPTAGVTATLARRRALSWMLLPAAGLVVPAAWASAARIASARVWPAQEYTRLILEGPTPIAHQLLLLKDPHRIVLDLDGVELGPELAQLPSRVQAERSLHRRHPLRAEGPRRAARGHRPARRGDAATLRAEAGCRVRPPGRPRPLSAEPRRSADGAARGDPPAGRRGAGARARSDPGRRGEAGPAARRAAPHHHRPRSRARRRGPGRRRAPRHLREERGAGDRAQAQDDDRRRAGDAGDAHPRRRLLRSAGAAGAEGAARARRPLRLDPRRRVQGADGARFVGVRAVGERGHERRGELARAEGERRRPDRRREPRRPRPRARADAARPVAGGADQRQPQGGAARAGGHPAGQPAAQAVRRAGRLRRAEGAGHPVDPGRDRVHLQSRRGTEAAKRPPPEELRRVDPRRDPPLLRAEPALARVG